ncbi:uncharacterized protein, partial [Clinocottus analis]|uniref:uncharacterized protein n=1 Tax=Clinocottus analis TaxID=304258 RepID=UPI0035C14779
TSCVVVPCSFTHPQENLPSSRLRGTWHPSNDRNQRIYGEDLVGTTRLPQAREFKYLGVLFTSEGKVEREIDRRIGAAAAVKQAPYRSVMVKRELSRPETPSITISGTRKVGQPVVVQCTASHTCSSHPPTLSLNIPLRSHSLTHSSTSGGKYKTTLTTTLYIESDHQTVECSVRHVGGSFAPLTISNTDEFLEGEARTVTCTTSYTCSKHIPVLTWNYGSMPASTETRKTGTTEWRSVSTLTFTASAKDDGRALTCSARFAGAQTQERGITLRQDFHLLPLFTGSMLSRGWSFTTPGSISGMRGSCIIIPCTFSYSISQPADLRVIWYLFQRNRYPAVFDEGQTIVSKFNGRTSLVGSVGERNCSLKIERLEMSHNKDRLYPWVDKNPITSYHGLGDAFEEKTSQLIVTDNAQEPQLSIIGIPRVGEESTVSCVVRHTCASAPPAMSLDGVLGKEVMTDTLVSDGIWERTLERTWLAKEEDQSVTCAVSHPGGQKATSELKLNVECPYEEITMTERPGETTEGVAKSVICSVSYKCKKNKPTIVWNYEHMQSSLKTKDMSGNAYNVVSNLTFIGSLEDDGKSLTCTAQFDTGETSDSEILHIKKYVRPIDPYENDTLHVRAAAVPYQFSALTRSCVVIPCGFPYLQDEPVTRGIWTKKNGHVIYHNARSYVVDHFKGRTRILGDLNEGNCTLEIDDIKPFDNGPFCFHAERGNHDRHRFNNSCVFIVMKASPEKPAMTSVPDEIRAGATVTVSCSVPHTCPTHPPEFSWSVRNLTSEVTHTSASLGIWQTTSTITFTAAGGDEAKALTCTAVWWRGKQQATTVMLSVKGSSTRAAAISVSTLLLVGVIIAAAFVGVVFYRRRKHSEDSQRPPPRPEKRRSLWDRLSRRNTDDRERPPRPEKRNRRPPHTLRQEVSSAVASGNAVASYF